MSATSTKPINPRHLGVVAASVTALGAFAGTPYACADECHLAIKSFARVGSEKFYITVPESDGITVIGDAQNLTAIDRWAHSRVDRLSLFATDTARATIPPGQEVSTGSYWTDAHMLSDFSMIVGSIDPFNDNQKASPALRLKNELIAEIRSLSLLRPGWAGAGTSAPSKQTIDDAIALIHLWPEGVTLPEASITDDGNPFMELFDGDLAVGGVEFVGGGEFAYAIVKDDRIVVKGKADSKDTADMLRALDEIKSVTGA